jgi:hypothetical protein
MNTTLLKYKLLDEFLAETQKHRCLLLEELLDNATDPVIKKRRFRMLSNLSTFESSMIKKIYDFETDNPGDLLIFHTLTEEIDSLLDRSA